MKNKMISSASRLMSMLLLLHLLTACPPAPQDTLIKTDNATTLKAENVSGKPKLPKNVIFLIGDGMGVSQISAGLYSNNNRLNFEKFSVIGLHKSYSHDDLVTDSAAGATAFSAGVKTYNGAIGVDADTMPVKTILEMAEEQEWSTGLVASSSIVHATPASFIAHNRYRKNYEEIAADFLNTEIDFFIGGGAKYFERRETDERNLTQELKEKGYVVESYFNKDIGQVQPDVTKNFAFLTADTEPLPVAQGRDYLVPASVMAISFLSRHGDSQKGYFLMIEGSQIDWGGHANDTDYIISEMLEFDKVVGEALSVAENDGETLVIVTADHETGGFAINKGSSMGDIQGAFTSDYHTADLIPVFAFGPGAEMFSGIYENTAIFEKLRELMNLKNQ